VPGRRLDPRPELLYAEEAMRAVFVPFTLVACAAPPPPDATALRSTERSPGPSSSEEAIVALSPPTAVAPSEVEPPPVRVPNSREVPKAITAFVTRAKLREPVNPHLGVPCPDGATYQPVFGGRQPLVCSEDGVVSVEHQWLREEFEPPCVPKRHERVSGLGVHEVDALCLVGEILVMRPWCGSCFAPGSPLRLYDLGAMTPAQLRDLRQDLGMEGGRPEKPSEWARFVAKLPSE
jgi:hypothetical protein